MQNTDNTQKNIHSTTPAWHIGMEAFVALLIMLVVPLVISIRAAVVAITSSIPPQPVPKTLAVTSAPKQAAQSKMTLTKFLAAAVFGVGEQNVVTNPNTGVETIILPYGGQTDAGGSVQASGNTQSGGFIYQPHTDGTAPSIYRNPNEIPPPVTNFTTEPISSGGAINNGQDTEAGGNIQAGGEIQSGGTI